MAQDEGLPGLNVTSNKIERGPREVFPYQDFSRKGTVQNLGPEYAPVKEEESFEVPKEDIPQLDLISEGSPGRSDHPAASLI